MFKNNGEYALAFTLAPKIDEVFFVLVTATICQVTAKRLWLESGITKPDDMRLPGDPVHVRSTAIYCVYFELTISELLS